MSGTLPPFVMQSLTAYSKRWCQFGLLSSHSRLHGSGSPRVPWSIDDEACRVLSAFTKLKGRLEPYLTSQSITGVVQNGLPMMRALFVEFPRDRTAWLVDQQYMLGEHLLVAPVFGESDVEYYLPVGVWTNILTGSEVTGSRWVRESHDMTSLPLLLRPGSAIIIGKSGHLVTDSIAQRGFTVLISRQCVDQLEVVSVLRGDKQVSVSIKPTLSEGDVVSYTVTASDASQNFDVLVVGGDGGLLAGGAVSRESQDGACQVAW